LYRFEDYFFNDLIGVSVFCRCSLLQSINIPRYVRVNQKGAFEECHGLMMADLGKGLKIIGAGAYFKPAVLSITLIFPVVLDQFKNGHFHI
jgi:hypothetical protein